MRLCRFAVICVMFTIWIVFAGCSESAEELYKTAQFEELQNNQDHARELYQEIVRKYPDSDFSRKAREKLDALGDK